MLRKKVGESLTARVFLITALILLCAGGITFGLIAYATPSTYTAVVNDDLTRQVDVFTARLADASFEDCGPLLDAFIRSSGADAILVGPDGQIVGTAGSQLTQSLYESMDWAVSDAGGTAAAGEDSTVAYATGQIGTYSAVTVTMSGESMIMTDVLFADREEVYSLYVTPRVESENLAVRALIQMAPWLLLVLLAFSLLCALVYSRYITRPIVRLSGIAGKMAELRRKKRCAAP